MAHGINFAVKDAEYVRSMYYMLNYSIIYIFLYAMTFGNEIQMVKEHFRLNSPKSQQDDMQDDRNLIESST